MGIQVDIVTPERLLVSDEVDMVTLPGVDGQMGILRGHAPLLSTLDIGEIVLHRGTDAEYMAIGGGVVEVRPDKVTILADTAEQADTRSTSTGPRLPLSGRVSSLKRAGRQSDDL